MLYTLKRKYIFLCLLGMLANPIFSDSYHNINGFFGERASGLGGSYSAISDDPSGAFYNPAGLAFSFDNAISLSASQYTKVNKNFKNVLGPGQSYEKNSSNYIPNFFGIVRAYGDYKIAFSIVNPVNESFNRTEQIRSPLYYPSVTNIRNYVVENNRQIQTGFSIARSISDKFSLGATLYYTYDTAQLNSTQIGQFKDKSFNIQTGTDNRNTRGFLPILGLMYMPIPKLSIGASIRHQFYAGGHRLTNISSLPDSSATPINTDSLTFYESTDKRGGGSVGNVIVLAPNQTARIPQTTEMRLGFAFFASQKFMLTGDVIYTSGYKKSTNQTTLYRDLSTQKNTVIFSDGEIQELRRYSTTNFAGGIEYYITDNFSIRAGVFTNYANTKKNFWLTSALRAANSANATQTLTQSGLNTYQLTIPALRDVSRNEYVNNLGYSLGLSWSTAKASIGFIYIRERGSGQSQLDSSRPIQQMTYASDSFYLVVSSKNN